MSHEDGEALPAQALRPANHELPVCRHGVDDDPDIRELVRFKVEASGHELLTAPDGEAGLAAVREPRPDLVLADWMMPKVAGIELLGRMREDPRPRASRSSSSRPVRVTSPSRGSTGSSLSRSASPS